MNPKPNAQRWKPRLQNLALSAGVFLGCAVGVEIVLRFAGYGNLEIYQPDPKLYWRLAPNQHCFTKVDHQPVHINSQGTRGAEFAADKPTNTFRILSLGDSRTFGWGLSEAETYSSELGRLLQDYLKAHAPLTPALSPSDGERENTRRSFGAAQRVEVINAGVNAWSYPQMLVFYRDVAAAWQPDVVILAEANLWTQFSERNSDEFVRQFMSRVRLKNFLRRFAIYHYVVEVKLKDFYARNRTKFIPVNPNEDPLFKAQQQNDPDAVFRTAMEELVLVARSNGVPTVLLFIPTLDDLATTNQSRVLTVKQAVNTKLGVPLVDLTSDLAAGGKSLYLEADPVHLNAAGNELTARRLFQIVTNSLLK